MSDYLKIDHLSGLEIKLAVININIHATTTICTPFVPQIRLPTTDKSDTAATCENSVKLFHNYY